MAANFSATVLENMTPRVVGRNVWLRPQQAFREDALELQVRELTCEVMESEEVVGRAQFEEIQRAAGNKEGDLVIILLGGRRTNTKNRMLGEMSRTDEIDHLLKRLHIFTQDALA